MKCVSISSINSTLTELRSFTPNFRSHMKVKIFSTILISIILYCKHFWNEKVCVHKYTRLITLPVDNTHTELEPISNPLPESSDQLSLQIIHEIWMLQTSQGKTSYSNSGYKKFMSKLIHKYTMCNVPLQLTTSHMWSCQSGTITNFLHFILDSVLYSY